MRTPISLAIALLPAMAFAFVPTVDQKTVDAAAAIHADPAMKALLADLETPEAKDARFAAHMEIVRIISPSRYELRRQAEITRRLTTDWGFDAKDIMSRTDGHLPGAGVQTVDGLPVYNVCVRIPGTYSQTPGAKNYKGQFPKVLIEGHIQYAFMSRSVPEGSDRRPHRHGESAGSPSRIQALRPDQARARLGPRREDPRRTRRHPGRTPL